MRVIPLDEARLLLSQGKIIAYPTEAVYGLGCDPFNSEAVDFLLSLKIRPMSKGFIILIGDWSQLAMFVPKLSDAVLKPVQASWPGPVTWVFPRLPDVPPWLTGEHDGIAIRMTAHPIAHALCQDGPIISSSANRSGEEPARDFTRLSQQFPQCVEACVAGDLGGASQPSAIYDALSGHRLR